MAILARMYRRAWMRLNRVIATVAPVERLRRNVSTYANTRSANLPRSKTARRGAASNARFGTAADQLEHTLWRSERASLRIPRPRWSWTIDTRNKVPTVHISIRSNPKGNSIAAVVPYGHLQYSPRAIVLQRPSMYALARLPMTFTFILTRRSMGSWTTADA